MRAHAIYENPVVRRADLLLNAVNNFQGPFVHERVNHPRSKDELRRLEERARQHKDE